MAGTSWHLDNTKPAPQQQKQSGAAKEHDYSSTSTTERTEKTRTESASDKSTVSVTANTDRTIQEKRAAPTFTPADMLNPYQFSLKRILMKRTDSKQAWGFQIANVAGGVVQVVDVTPGGPAAATGMDKNAYVFSIRGKRLFNVKDVAHALKNDRQTLRMTTVIKRQTPLDPNSFRLTEPLKRHPNFFYMWARINPTDDNKVGTGIAENRDGKVCISVVLEKSAGAEAGLQTGDRILMVDGDRIRDKDQCALLVQETKGEPFDMLIRRPVSSVTKQSPTSATAVQASSSATVPMQKVKPGEEYEVGSVQPSGYAASQVVQTQSPQHSPAARPRPRSPGHGDPTSGVPEVPADVVVLQNRARQVIEKVATNASIRGKETKQADEKKKSKEKKKKLKKKAKVIKDVKSSTLRKDETPEKRS